MLAACGTTRDARDDGGGTDSLGGGLSLTAGGEGPGSATGNGADGADSSDGGAKFDLAGGTGGGAGEGGGPVDVCKVANDMDAVGDCEEFAPPDSFEPDTQWTFGADEQSWVTPLVGNFTDDNADGEIDLCDIPDVLLVANAGIGYGVTCFVHVLDGATGVEHFAIQPSEGVSCTATPAFGDIDGDGLP